MKSRQAQLKELRCTIKKIAGPIFLAVLPLISLWAGAEAIDSLNLITGNSSSPWLVFGLGALCLVVLTFYYPMKRVKLEGRLEDALNLLDRFTPQGAIDSELTVLAQAVAEASEHHIKAQVATKRARGEKEEEILSSRENDERDHFNRRNDYFHKCCAQAESSGYKVLKTSKGKPSFKLYLLKSSEGTQSVGGVLSDEIVRSHPGSCGITFD